MVITSLVVEADKGKASSRVAKVVEGVVTAGNGVFKRERNSVKMTVRNAHPPNEFFDVGHMLLVRFGCKNNGRIPRTIAWADPTIMQ